MVDAAHAAGMRVIPWTVNDIATMNHPIDTHVDGIITDYPDRLRDLLEVRAAEAPRRGVPGGFAVPFNLEVAVAKPGAAGRLGPLNHLQPPPHCDQFRSGLRSRSTCREDATPSRTAGAINQAVRARQL